jgi:hypothetical protein
MKTRLSVLAVALLLPAAVPAQTTSLDDSSAASAAKAPLPLLSDDSSPTAASASLLCVAVPPGAVAWWRAQSNTVDTIGVNDGLLDEVSPRGSIAYTPGKVGAALRFVAPRALFGVTNYLFVPPSADLDVGPGPGLTIEGWLSPSSIAGVQPVAEWNDGSGNIGAGLALNGSALEISLTDTNASPARRVILRSAPGRFGPSVWHHVALTFDSAAGQATAYVDGVAVAQTNLGAFRPATQTSMYLGSHPSGTNADTFYAGTLDEVTVYRRALTAAELQAIVAADSAGKCVPPPPLPVAPPDGLVGWWRGESNTLDSADFNNGSIVSSVSYMDGAVGKALRSYGGYVRIPSASNLNLGLGPGLTVEAWIWPVSSSRWPVPGSAEFVGWHSGLVTRGVSLALSRVLQSTPNPPFPIYKNYSLFWDLTLADTQGVSHLIRSPADLATVGLWQHVAFTYEKATGTAVLYFNGNPVTQTNLGSFTPQTAADLNLGYQTSSPFPGWSSFGALDEVSLYARALAPAEIRAIMLARGAGKRKDAPAILSQPAAVRANVGATVSFAVTASGNPMLKYQWRQNGLALPGATGSTLVLANLQLAQAGAYSVRITNAFGVALSPNALLTVNQPPVADASATQPQVIAPLHCDATVALDGSRSSDPDGDTLHCLWFKAGVVNPFATGVVAVVRLPAGVNPLILVADDGLATNSQSFTVQVLTLAQAVERLIARVNAQAPRPRPLVATLSAALSSINRSAPTPAINQLEAFQNKTRAQVSPADPALAQTFIQTAQQLVAILSTDCSPARPSAKIGKVTRQANGKLRMHFSAPQGFVYILEASTNLVDWERIGVAQDGGSGGFDFEDVTASQVPARFYRLSVP